MFFVEVMGRDAGFIALRSGIACGAEDVLIPETVTYLDEVHDKLVKYMTEKKTSSIILVAEGDDAGGAYDIRNAMAKYGEEFDMRVIVLGHIQRGGSPSAYDRYLASRLGVAAIDALLDDQRSVMCGMVHNEIVLVPFNKTIKHHKTIDQKMLDIVDVLNS